MSGASFPAIILLNSSSQPHNGGGGGPTRAGFDVAFIYVNKDQLRREVTWLLLKHHLSFVASDRWFRFSNYVLFSATFPRMIYAYSWCICNGVVISLLRSVP